MPLMCTDGETDHQQGDGIDRDEERVGETDGDSHAMFFSLSVHAGVWPACTG